MKRKMMRIAGSLAIWMFANAALADGEKETNFRKAYSTAVHENGAALGFEWATDEPPVNRGASVGCEWTSRNFDKDSGNASIAASSVAFGLTFHNAVISPSSKLEYGLWAGYLVQHEKSSTGKYGFGFGELRAAISTELPNTESKIELQLGASIRYNAVGKGGYFIGDEKIPTGESYPYIALRHMF